MSEHRKGEYQTVPLRSDEISVGIVQSRVLTDRENPERGKRENVAHLLKLVDIAQTSTLLGHLDLVVFHEFPIGGFDFDWNRNDMLNDVAIEVPGEETAAIGEKAKEHNCYVHFGCYGKLADWPGHFMNLGIIVDPSGNIIYQRWKLRNIPGMGFSTTVYDVVDEFVERYGWEAVFPVARTDIGNLAVIPETFDPELSRAFALYGTEIMIRYMTGAGGGAARLDLQAACLAGKYYGLYVNNAQHYVGGVEVDLGAGGSAFIDPKGNIICETNSTRETVIAERIPIAAHRAQRTTPQIPIDLLKYLYSEYQPKYPANSFTGQPLPDNFPDSIKHYRGIARW